ncbi:MAG: hypothetical protein AAFO94_01115 [Bacteroidota bacterium]
MINKQTFAENLHKATDYALAWAREHVTNSLPEKVRYYIENDVYLDKSLWSYEEGRYFDPSELYNADTLVNGLLEAGCSPRKIYISLMTTTETYSVMTISFKEEFTYNEEEFRNRESGFAPFHALSPSLPPEYKVGMPKFDLFWDVKKTITL